ncbi:MAG TPA: GNAT family N-acetyltransferase [Gemmatimonadales bacterium]|jgi:RimJ/RimL family protein N-acetyltransferase
MDASHVAVNDISREGAPLHVRSIRADDKARLAAFHRRLSTESVYLRFFEFKRELSPSDLRYLTELDFEQRVALVATLAAASDAPIIGVARFDVLPDRVGAPRRAELGIVVEDAHQGQGIGTILLKHLLALAHDKRIAEITAEVLPQNTRMLELIAGSGVPVRRSVEDGVIRLLL